MSERRRKEKGHDARERNGDASGGKSEVLTEMSVEATNKMRADLGLPPLIVEDQVDHAAAEEARAKEQQKETEDLREELAKRKRARLAKQSEEESLGLGDKLTSVVGGSAADWLARSRQIHEQLEKDKKIQTQKEKEEKKKKVVKQEVNDPGYHPDQLAGLKVKHGAEEFVEGKDTILTLADSYIVKHVDGQERLDEDEDVLENLNLIDEQKRKRNEDRKKKKIGYDVHDEKGATVLLAQYEPEKDYVGEMRLGTAAQHLADIRAKLREDLEEKKTGSRGWDRRS